MRYLVFTLLCAGPFVVYAQGPLDGYMKGKSALDIAPSFSFMRAADFAGAGGRIYDEPYNGNMLSVFAEYGLSDNFDLVATIPYVFTANQKGLQDGGAYVKYRPFYSRNAERGALGLILGLGLSFPMSDYEPLVAGALGQRAVTVPARVMLQWDSPTGPFIHIGGGYHPRIDRLKAGDIEMVRRTRPDYNPEEPRPYATVLVKAGYPATRFYADAWIEWQRTRGGADYTPLLIDLPQAYGVSYTQAGGTFYYSERGAQGAFISGAYILNGRNVSRVLRVSIGLVFKIKG